MPFTNVLPGSGVYPDLKLEWAPTTKPTDAVQTWTDITDRLRGFDWGYGRNDELASFEAGSGSVILSNNDRKLDPTYTAGAWYGNIKPRKMFRLQAQWAGVTYPLFVAYARGFPQAYPGDGIDSLVSVSLVDALAMLQTYDLSVGFTRDVERSDVRIGAALDAITFPSGSRDLDAGTVDVDAITVDSEGTSALGHAKDVSENGEYGALFVAKDGRVTFHNYTRRLNAASLWTFSDAGFLPYATDVQPQWDDTYLWNYARVTGSAEATSATTTDAASQLDYFPITKAITSPIAGGTERQQLADRLAAIYAQPLLRVPSLPLNGAMKPASLWPAILDLEVSDRITFVRTPKDVHGSAVGTAISVKQNVEGIRHTCTPGGPWLTAVPLSPADERNYMVADDATLGICDTTNVAA